MVYQDNPAGLIKAPEQATEPGLLARSDPTGGRQQTGRTDARHAEQGDRSASPQAGKQVWKHGIALRGIGAQIGSPVGLQAGG